MEVLYPRCAGLDVHKKTVVACRIVTQTNGHKEQEIRTFGTMTADLLHLSDWLQEWECTHVVMESTGEYWRPIWNILEGHFELLLVNARHVHAVPGRKTDVKDAEWLADLLRHGLLRSSFVPPRPQRELRDLTRQRSNLIRERVAVVNRVQKVLEDANIKLAGVATDVAGVSGRAILEALVKGPADPAVMAELSRGRLRNKRAEMEKALTGRVREHHRFLLVQHLAHIDFLDEQIERFNAEIAARIQQPDPPRGGAGPEEAADSPSTGDEPAVAEEGSVAEGPLTRTEALALIDSIPGLNQRGAESVIAEIGIDMQRFGSAHRLSAWAGIAPGNHESAGKHYSGRTTPGNRALRRTLIQAAHAAARKKDCFLAAQYHRLSARRGKKRAIVAVAHSILVIIYHVLARREAYRELGGSYYDEQKRQATTNRLTRRLEKMGYEVTLKTKPKPVAVPAAA